MSAEIQSLFDPSGSLLATVVTSLSSHKIQIQSVKSSATSSLSTSFLLDRGTLATSLEWGYLTSSVQVLENLMLIIGTNDGKILLYSPSTNALIDTLQDELSNDQIVAVHFSSLSNSIWSIDGKNLATEWSLSTFRKSRSINNLLKNSSATNNEALKVIKTFSLENEIHLLVASHKVYVYKLSSGEIVHEISNHITPIEQLVLFDNDNYLITTAKSDRFINAYDTKNNFKPIKVFVAQSNVQSVSFGSLIKQDQSLLSAVTEDGVCELFYNPLKVTAVGPFSGVLDGTARRKKRQSQGSLSKISDSQVKLSRPQPAVIEEQLAVFNSVVLNDQVLITWFENATIPYFEFVNWFDQSTSKFGLERSIVLKKAKPIQRQINHSTYGHDVAASNLYNENNVFLSVGDNYRDLDEEDNDFADVARKFANSQNVEDESIIDDDPDETLGDKLLSLNPKSKALKSKRGVSNQSFFDIDRDRSHRPTTGSLTVILTQALKSNDHSLLESVLSTKDESIIQQTIKNLNSELSIILLDKLSEKYNFVSSVSAATISYQKQIQLNYWIKWVLIIHGSYLKTNEINDGNKSSNRINGKQLLKNLSFLLVNLNKKSAQLSKIMLLQNKLNSVFEKVNYKNELLRDFNNPQASAVKSGNKKKSFGVVRYDNASDDEYMSDGSVDSDIEYNEELDDADLMEDGEEDVNDDDESEEDGYQKLGLSDESDDDENDFDENMVTVKGNEGYDEDQYGNSDVEVGIAKDDEDDIILDNEDEDKQYEKKIQKLRSKNKSKSKK